MWLLSLSLHYMRLESSSSTQLKKLTMEYNCGVKWLGHASDHSLTSSNKVKNTWHYMLSSPVYHYGMVLGDNFLPLLVSDNKVGMRSNCFHNFYHSACMAFQNTRLPYELVRVWSKYCSSLTFLLLGLWWETANITRELYSYTQIYHMRMCVIFVNY
jgi:hypothetical protein